MSLAGAVGTARHHVRRLTRRAASWWCRDVPGRRRPSVVAIAVALLAALLVAGAAMAARPPTKAERRAIINAVRAGNEFVGAAPRRCDAAARVRVSTVDRRYAVWTQDNRRAERIGGCVVGDGYIILRFQPNGRWRIRTQGSGGAPCSVTGVRIAKDLLPGLPCD